MAYDLAIVLPTFNERGNVGPMIDRLERALMGIHYEVIFVDDDSPDGTAEAVRQMARDRDNVRVLHRIGRRGLASACIEGILAAAAPFVAVMDADLQHDESILPEMLRRMREENLDLVVGSRNLAGGSMGEFARWRVKLSHLGKRLSLMGAEHELSDPMSGFFLVRVSTFEQFAHRLSGIGFKILLDIVLSAGPGLRVGEVAYRFRQREHGESKLDVLVGLEYFELLVDKHLGDLVNVKFVLFGMVGALGVGVHLLILRALLQIAGLSFAKGQAVTTFIVMILNFTLNNSVTYRDRRLKGWRFWGGLLTFCLACGLGVVANVAIANEAFRRGVPWVVAAITGLLFSAVWNYGVTSMTTWRQARRTSEQRARRRLQSERSGDEEIPAKTV
ncbi:Glycosyl transferase, group 2 family protein [Candidatus Sulfotelmatomonas gaucii]|uniref:Glycosyl transferase, group 2 family protein n=1 Tax=Candidatus Sulfuritelmatomonas gaucii TaxID=2043161 RepID=A0A2N9M8M5_9BACT|nr:Glycosyl transferase, group 2 family protein [Candidatus Sulfotelmatomonas gaucii]